MKKWKKCPLLIVTAISMLLVSGVALAGTKGAYKEYNKDWPKVPADRKSTRLNSSHDRQSRMPSSA